MKTPLKIVLATIVTALCVASLATSVAGTSVTGEYIPTGLAGVNFANVNGGLYDITWETLSTGNNFGTVTGRYTQTARYFPEHGDINVSLPFDISNGDMLRVVFDMGYGGQNIFKYLGTSGQPYYARAQVYVKYYVDSLIDGSPLYGEWYTQNNSTTFVMFDGSTFRTDVANPFYGENIAENNNVDVMMMTFPFTQFQGEDGTFSTIHVQEIMLLNFTITQGAPVNFNANQWNVYQSPYVPFNPAWFELREEQIVYGDGYEQGYVDGANDAGGEPIQRWSAFMLSAVSGFMSFEIFPGFPLYGLLSIAIAIPLLIWFLKYFTGG